MIDYEVKELTREDLIDDKKGLLDSLSNLTNAPDMNLGQMEGILLKINNQNGHVYIAKTEDNKIIGTATLLIEQKFIHSGGKVGHLEDVAVMKEYEKNGVASKIINSLWDLAKKEGCYKVILDCENNLEPYYNKFEFIKKGILMRRDINTI